MKVGDIVEIKTGIFEGEKGVVKKMSSRISIEIEIFGRKKESFFCYSHFGLTYKPEYRDFKSMINEFDLLYKEKAPLRYSHLNDGISRERIFLSEEIRTNSYLLDDFAHLLEWKNGMNMKGTEEGWINEFEENSWYELIPLDSSGHFMDIIDIEDSIEMWQEILLEATQKNEFCYWRKGFIPFLRGQNYAMTVIDTVGYFGGKPGQIIYFDYKGGDYSVIHENLNKWLETQLVLLKNGLFFSSDFDETEHLNDVNSYYTFNFGTDLD